MSRRASAATSARSRALRRLGSTSARSLTSRSIEAVGGDGMSEKAHASKRWVKNVKTDSTHPREGLFNKDAETIARELASKKVSPKGPGSGMRMLTYYINRAGHNLSAERRAELQRAKGLLSERVARAREAGKHKRAA